jgi:hypothetical protein
MAGAAGGQGGLVFVGGEAGIEKTTLVRRFVSGVGQTPVFTGTCDPLPTPLALGSPTGRPRRRHRPRGS